MEELKPCPFCGGKAKVRRSEFGYKAFCDKPFCCWMGTFRTEQEAIAAWNQRAERTCKVEWKHVGGDVAAGYCECGIELDRCHDYEPAHLPTFCPACGVKVVGD